MLQKQMLPGNLCPVKDCPRNLPMKFGENQMINSRDISLMEFVSVGGSGWVGGGLQSHFHVNPNFC